MYVMSPRLLENLLKLPQTEIKSIDLNTKKECIIRLESTQEGTQCHCCGQKTTHFHAKGPEIKLRHLPIFDHTTYLIIRLPRYYCPQCDKTTTQQVSWYTLKASCTKDYENHILLSLVNSTIKDVSVKENFGYTAIEGIIDRNIKKNRLAFT